MFIGEKLIQASLRQGVQDVLADATLLPSLYESLADTEQQEALQWFRENSDAIVKGIQQGYPRKAPLGPTISIVVGSSNEIEEYIGSSAELQGQTMVKAIRSSSTFRCMVLSTNADEVTWLSAFVKFILLRSRDLLEQDGLMNQKVGMADLMPDMDWEPEFYWQRAVLLSGEHHDSWPVSYAPIANAFETIASIDGGNGPVAGLSQVIFPTSDSFIRPDAANLNLLTTGQSWQQLAGVWGISSNNAYCSASTAANFDMVVMDSGVADCAVRVVLVVNPSQTRIVFRATDVGNAMMLEAAGGTYSLYSRVNSGAWTAVPGGSFARVPAPVDIVRIVLSGASIKVYVGSTLIGSASSTLNQAGTKHGLGAGASAIPTARFANFLVS